MNTNKFFQRALVLVSVCMALQLLPAAAVKNAGAQPEPRLAAISPIPIKASKRSSTDNVDLLSSTAPKKIESDKVTSFFVRANDSKRIQLSMLVAYKQEFTHAVRAVVGQKVTPLVFSVSTLPNRAVNFDPTLLRFEQKGRVWQPSAEESTVDFLPVEEGGQFGGTLAEGQTQQGVVFLPEWFDPQIAITVRYKDFHYLAHFADAAR